MPAMRRILAFALMLGGLGLALAASRIEDPYQVNPVTVLECRLARWLGEGIGAGTLLTGAWVLRWASRRALLRLAAVALSALLAFLLGEGVLRAMPAPKAFLKVEGLGKADAVRHHRNLGCLEGFDEAPEWNVRIRTNSLGMRGPEPEASPSRRILVLGDSYVEGYGVEEAQTLSSRLGGLMAPAEVLNGGCGSYSPLLEWMALREWGPRLRPDLVILALDCSDLQDDASYSTRIVKGPDGAVLAVDALSRGGADLPSPRTRFIEMTQPLKASRLYLTAKHAGHALCAWAIRAWRLRIDLKAAGDVKVDRLAATRAGTGERLRPDLERTQGNLLRIRDLCRTLGSGFVIVTYPYAHQVNGREWAEGRVQWGFLPGDVSDTWLMREMTAFGAREGIEVIDLTEDFRGASGFPLYYPRDGHWTAEGHRIAAEGIAKRLGRFAK